MSSKSLLSESKSPVPSAAESSVSKLSKSSSVEGESKSDLEEEPKSDSISAWVLPRFQAVEGWLFCYFIFDINLI